MNNRNNLKEEKSASFIGNSRETIEASRFNKINYIMNKSPCNSEGNWAFCRFKNDNILGARLGFQKGSYDFSDFGGKPIPDYLLLHLEVVRKDGALLWISLNKYKPMQVVSDSETMEVGLKDGGKRIFDIHGWPSSIWHFQSDDCKLEANLNIDLFSSTIFPDCILPKNTFSMWLSIGSVKGLIRCGEEETIVEGMAFHDHPRIRIENNSAIAREWFIYAPLFFDDETALISYYSVDSRGKCIDYYSFGILAGKEERSEWLSRMKIFDLRFDDNNLPKEWRLHWSNGESSVDGNLSVVETPLIDAWGSPNAPKKKSEFSIFPLVFEGECVFRSNSKHVLKKCKGIAEYWKMPSP